MSADGSIVIDTRIDGSGADKGIAELNEKLSHVGEGLKTAGENMSKYVTLPLTLLGGLAVKTVSDIDGALGRLAATTDRTAEDTREMQAAAKELWANNYGADINETADAISAVDRNLGDLAANADEVKNLTEQAFMLKDAFGYEIAGSTRAAAQLMQHFGSTGEDSMNMIAKAAQKGGDYSDELIDTITEYSTYFEAAGFSAEQMFDTLLAGAKNGAWNMDKVGDAVKEFNIRAKDGSKGVAEGFAAIGMNAGEMGQKIAGGGEAGQQAFMATIAGLSQMDDKVAMTEAGVALFGTQWEDLESTVMVAMGNSEGYLGEFEGTTAQMAEELYNNFGAKLEGAFRQAQLALLPLGNILLDLAEKALPILSKAVEDLSKWFSDLSPSTQQMIVIFGLIASAIGPVLVVVGMLVTAISSIGLIAVGIIAGILLLAGAFILLWTKSETFRNAMITIFEAVKEKVLTAFGIVKDFLLEKFTEIKAFWDQIGPQFLEAVTNVFNGIKAAIDFIMPAVLFVIKFVWGAIKQVISGALDIIMGVVKIFTGLFTADWGLLWDGIKQLIGGAITFILGLMNLSFLGGIKTIFLNLGKAALTSMKSMVTGVGTFFKGLYTSSVSTVNSMVSGIIHFFTVMFARASSIFGTLRTFGASIFQSIKAVIVNTIRGAVDGAVNLFRSLVSGAKSQFDGVWSAAKSIFGKIKDAITNPIETAKNTLSGIIDKIKGLFANMKVKIPMPHFNFSSGTKNIAGIDIPYPKVDVEWYANGGVFPANSPRMVGIGDNKQYQEAAIPLSPKVLGMIGDKIANTMGPSGANTQPKQPVIIQVVTPDKRAMARWLSDDITEFQEFKLNRF